MSKRGGQEERKKKSRFRDRASPPAAIKICGGAFARALIQFR